MTLQTTPLDMEAAGSATSAAGYPIRFPQSNPGYEQDEEWCEVYLDGQWQRLRLHDYADIYRAPGLYEHLFARTLQCCSPQRVVELLGAVLRDASQCPMELRVLDFGAGNGMVGSELRRMGVRSLVGADILPEAAEAAQRDRPGLYDEYVVADFCQLDEVDRQRVLAHRPNCLCTVAALGFGDIPPKAFTTALNLISTPGWLAFNIKETFLSGADGSGFSRLIRALSDRDIIQIQAYRRYSHRLSIAGQRLHYVAMAARKLKPVPADFLPAVAPQAVVQ